MEDPLGRVTTTIYDGMRRPVEQIDALRRDHHHDLRCTG